MKYTAGDTEYAEFSKWMGRVDKACWANYGVSIHDLSDCPFRDWFEDEMPPAEAAARAVQQDGWMFDEDDDFDFE